LTGCSIDFLIEVNDELLILNFERAIMGTIEGENGEEKSKLP
jgi:hypothetical protein